MRASVAILGTQPLAPWEREQLTIGHSVRGVAAGAEVVATARLVLNPRGHVALPDLVPARVVPPVSCDADAPPYTAPMSPRNLFLRMRRLSGPSGM